ncbi:MAG TPA: hypothetical protein VMU67_11200 [Steroidobacteraceae bacterium]|nr:hypothetical protein [Steroidobacteraceae bacterium]
MRVSGAACSTAPLVLVLGVCLGIAAVGPRPARAASEGSEAGATEAVPAHWVQKKINFVYQGFTTHYSCEGLASDVRHVLRELGARASDLRVHEMACTSGLGVPTPFPGVVGTFSVLVPLSSAQAPGSGAGLAPVPAHWVKVHVRLNSSDGYGGQCELIDQIKERIIPLVTSRNVKFNEQCIPHELVPPGSQLEVEVLVPVGAKAVERARN